MCVVVVHRCLAYAFLDSLSVSAVPAVMEELNVAQKKWRIIGKELGVGKDLLDGIRSRYSEPENRLMEVLRERVARQATSWGDIIAVLKTPRVGQSQLADQLEAKYCPSELANLQHSTLKVVFQYIVIV